MSYGKMVNIIVSTLWMLSLGADSIFSFFYLNIELAI